ncbi:leucine-rich repeat, cysteine-containing subtype protein [Tanacetum coccineum]
MVVSAFDLQLLAANRGRNLESLEIWGCKMFSEDGLVDIARYCIDLRSLSLKNNYIENDYMPNGKWLHELALCNTVVESLNLHDPFDWCDMKDVTRLAKKCSMSLVSLDIFPQRLSNLGKVFKHAKKLIHFGYGIIDEDWDYSGFKFPPNIRGLRIEQLIDDQFPCLHPYLNQLWELNIECAHLQPNCQCLLFENCPSLEVLHTRDICRDEGLQVIGQFCKKLRKLNHGGWVTQMGLIALAQGCPNLDYIKVYLLDISNEALECVGTHLKNLCDFRIFWDIDICLGGFTDVGLGYIGEYGHNRRHLSLGYTGESDTGLLELSKGCPKLRKLKLKACPFSKQAIATYVFNNNHSLRWENLVKKKSQKLNVERLDDFTKDNLQEIACPSRSEDHAQEVKNVKVGLKSKVCCNEEEVQADIFAVERSGKHHEDKPGSGRSQCADKATSITVESFQDVTQKVNPTKEEKPSAGMKRKRATPTLSKPKSKAIPTPMPAVKSSSKKTTASTASSKIKIHSVSESRRIGPMSLHLSSSMNSVSSDTAFPVTTSRRRSLFMEQMGDKDIVKRAFKTFQNRVDPSR